jgi:hypothetical protein
VSNTTEPLEDFAKLPLVFLELVQISTIATQIELTVATPIGLDVACWPDGDVCHALGDVGW